ncbi:MAG TPA: ABC transporter permease [Polyangiales bacterium]|nr:ABC transporter permease [Polyangiales bacterium]
MSAIVTIALKDLRLVLRDHAGLFWIAAFPILFALFLGAVLERWSSRDDLALTVGLADLDRSPEARNYVARLMAAGTLTVHESGLDAARASLQHGDIDAVVVLQKGFGAVPDWYAGTAEVMHVEADPSRRREAGYVKGLLLEAGLSRAIEDELMSDPRSAVKVVQAASLHATPSAAELVTPAAVLWGLIGCAAAFAISLASEKRAGTLRRLRSLPISDWQILTGKALACFSACLAIAVAILAGALLGFGVRLESALGLAMAVVALTFCFTGIMAAISTMGSSEQAVAGAGWGSLLVLGMIGGIMVPRMIMPSWLVSLGGLSPVRWGLVALEHSLWRGGSALDWLLPCVWLVMMGLCGLCGGAMVLRRSAA